MPVFEKKQLEAHARVCFRLRECREARGLSLSHIAERTRINQKHLLAIEACRFDDIPFGTIYQKNFIKRYATALGLPAHELLDQFLDEEVTDDATRPVRSLSKKRLTNTPMYLRAGFLCTAVLILVSYLGFQVKESIDPPSLSVFSPPNGYITNTQALSIQGSTENETQISINGEAIVPGNNGEFKEKIYLSPGINTIVVSAKKKHGKVTTETRHVILKENNQFTLGPENPLN